MYLVNECSWSIDTNTLNKIHRGIESYTKKIKDVGIRILNKYKVNENFKEF